ncbi:STAS domain-containing protein [Lederbergia lenta]|uniref:Anti-sigma factor antagonist n=1 Tax=Lederbergia lenta TaxID=1467 RepID=A0A2X4W914_LEDLE|nr:STAS domain-containing protein [Lederbergia lenta]MCM3109711.1 STAS domain-containing protein [Lederbergia lenta]MEC2324538.1 STAS domain-containing protein [Lederbergia lenta]SQI59503.1 anti-sigma factor antagonist [Lederbergia lenta]
MEKIEQQLHQFMSENISNMTTELFDNIYSSGVGVYAEPKNSETFEKMREMNYKFNRAVTESLVGEEAYLKDWADAIAASRSQTATPLYDVIVNFSIFRSIYYSYIERFIDNHAISGKMVISWVKIISKKFDEATQLVTREYIHEYEHVFSSQQEIILELGTPVIKVDEGLGIIPLVGEIDTYRASKLMEHSLQKASHMHLENVILDLSGVPVIDTMVANQIFQLGETYNLLGIEMIITGIRPEIAQTSISLGLDFSKMKTFAHLHQAIKHLRN